jgi:hypothetical protein
MEKKSVVPERVSIDVILGWVLSPRRRQVTVTYFRTDGIVKVGLKPLGKATTLKGALRVARRKKRFRQDPKLSEE